MADSATTSFITIYDSFWGRVTDDMYLELTEQDTLEMLQTLLINSLPRFEFPRFDFTDYDVDEVEDVQTYDGEESNNEEVTAIIYRGGHFNSNLTAEEINIIATYMIVEWLGQQLASVENTRMKYSGSDFKFTSQANHMAKILTLKTDYDREGFHLQRLYKRRIADEDGIMRSTLDTIMSESPQGRKGI